MNIQLSRPLQLTGLYSRSVHRTCCATVASLQPVIAEEFHVLKLWFVCVGCSLTLSLLGSNTSETAGYYCITERNPLRLIRWKCNCFQWTFYIFTRSLYVCVGYCQQSAALTESTYQQTALHRCLSGRRRVGIAPVRPRWFS